MRNIFLFLIDLTVYLLHLQMAKFTKQNNQIFIFQFALEIRESIFGKMNLLVAIAHEELAYALYVHEYSSGKFEQAR